MGRIRQPPVSDSVKGLQTWILEYDFSNEKYAQHFFSFTKSQVGEMWRLLIFCIGYNAPYGLIIKGTI